MGVRTRTEIGRITFGEAEYPLARIFAAERTSAIGGSRTTAWRLFVDRHFMSGSGRHARCRGADAMQDTKAKNVRPVSRQVLNSPAPVPIAG